MNYTINFPGRRTTILVVLVGLAVLALVLSSCTRTIERPTDSDLPIDAPVTPASVTVGVGDQTVQISWDQVDGTAGYRLYRADTTAAFFRVYDSTAQSPYTDHNVSNGIVYFYRVAAVDANGLEGIPSPAVSARPGVFSVAINNDNDYANSLGVTVSLTAATASGSVRLSNTPELSSRPWVAFSTSKSWELTPGDGSKTVYAEFRDAAGATSLGQISDEIILDTRADIDSVRVIANGTVLGVGDTVRFLVATGESDGEALVDVGGTTVACFDDGSRGDDVSGDGVYRRAWIVPANADFEASTVTGRFTDRAGNQAEGRSAPTRLTVRQAPDPVSLFAFAESESQIEVSWTQSTATDFDFYRLFRNTAPQVDEQSTMIFSSSSKTATSFVDEDLESSTTYYYAVWVYDRTGLSAASPVASAQTLVNTAPDPVIVSRPLDIGNSTLRITWSESTADDFASFQVYRSETNQSSTADRIAIIGSRSTTQYEDRNLDLENTTYFYWVAVYDQGGLFTFSDVVSWAPPGSDPPDPVTLAIPQPVDTSRASLRHTWTQSQAENFESYRIYRSVNSVLNPDAHLIMIINSRSSTDYVDNNGDFKNRPYYYWIRVYDLSGQFSQSESVIWEP